MRGYDAGERTWPRRGHHGPGRAHRHLRGSRASPPRPHRPHGSARRVPTALVVAAVL